MALCHAIQPTNLPPAMESEAIVAREPCADFRPNWNLEAITVGSLAQDEVLVEVHASGICHTDVLLSSMPSGNPMGIAYPRIMGHEGAGIVRSIGTDVTTVSVGDLVLLSFYSCSSCRQCKSSHPAYCATFAPENFIGRKQNVTSSGNGEVVWSRFFGQSSFARHSIVAEASVVKVTDLIDGVDELKLVAPFGCGFQTGTGAILNVAHASSEDVVMVLGMGAVGMSSLLAAKIQGCKAVIAVDRSPSRLALAKELGATHVLDTNLPEFNLSRAVRAIFPEGVSISIDSTGVGELIDESYRSLARRGQLVLVASPPTDYKLSLDPSEMINEGRSITGCIEGDCVPRDTIPQMIRWFHEGRYPVDKLIEYFKVSDYQQALERLLDGSVLKPVLTWV